MTNSTINAGIAGFAHNAAGTERWSGGMTWLAENGPELVNLPEGTKITPAHQTRRILANDNAAPVIHIDASIHAPGADSAALARVEANQQQLARELPGRIISTVTDAMARGMIR
jgi:phage-related tail protein